MRIPAAHAAALLSFAFAVPFGAGCGKSDDKAAAKPAATTDNPGKPGAGDGAKPPAPTAKPLATLFGARPALPAPAAGLVLGTKKADAAKALPALFARGGLEVPEYPGVKFEAIVPGGDGPVTALRVKLPAADARAMLTTAWGAPVVGKHLDQEVLYWFDDAAGVRAQLKQTFKPEVVDLELDRYIPAKQLIGPAKDRFGFESTTLFGATPEAVEAAYKDYVGDPADRKPDSVTLRLLPTEYSGITFVQNKITAGKITQVHFSIPYDDHEDYHQALLAAVEAKWGKPIATDNLYMTFQKKPRILVEDNKTLHLLAFFVTQ